MPIKFLANHNTIIFGQTGCGKTCFMMRVIKEKLVHPFPKNIYYMYSVHQEFMNHHPEIKFIEGPDFDKVDTTEPCLLVIDDLILKINKEMASTFIMGSHHKKISLFFITQNLFPNCDIFRLMSNNSHYQVLFNNQRLFRQVNCMARQIFVGRDVSRILNAYKRAGEHPRGFILLSFSPLLPRDLTVITDFWLTCPSVYL